MTLGAGVEIYAKRVDSVHTEAYKVMGGLSRGGAALEEDNDPEAGKAHSTVTAVICLTFLGQSCQDHGIACLDSEA